jgi:hypothetical protein
VARGWLLVWPGLGSFDQAAELCGLFTIRQRHRLPYGRGSVTLWGASVRSRGEGGVVRASDRLGAGWFVVPGLWSGGFVAVLYAVVEVEVGGGSQALVVERG